MASSGWVSALRALVCLAAGGMVGYLIYQRFDDLCISAAAGLIFFIVATYLFSKAVK